jgi:hypothetical protein
MRGAELSYCVARRYLRLNVRMISLARLYDFIVLLSGALRSSSFHSLPGLGPRKENSSRVKI